MVDSNFEAASSPRPSRAKYDYADLSLGCVAVLSILSDVYEYGSRAWFYPGVKEAPASQGGTWLSRVPGLGKGPWSFPITACGKLGFFIAHHRHSQAMALSRASSTTVLKR